MKLNAKYVTFLIIAVASVYVMYHNERFLVEADNPVWQHYEPFKVVVVASRCVRRHRPSFCAFPVFRPD